MIHFARMRFQYFCTARTLLRLLLTLAALWLPCAAHGLQTAWLGANQLWGSAGAAADAACLAELGNLSYSMGYEGTWDQIYHFHCRAADGSIPPPPPPGVPYCCGWSDTVLEVYSCDGHNWATVDGSMGDLMLRCLGKGRKYPHCCGLGNPVEPPIRNKFQKETDYVGAGLDPLRFERSYNSGFADPQGQMGAQWRTNFERSITVADTSSPGASIAFAYRGDGRVLEFNLMSAGQPALLSPYDPAAAWVADADEAETLTRAVDSAGNTTGWTYYSAAEDAYEIYDANGRITSALARSGMRQTFSYDAQGRLSSVSDTFGRSLISRTTRSTASRR